MVIEKFASQKAINASGQFNRWSRHLVKMEAIDAIKRLKWKYTHLKIKDRFVIDKVLDDVNYIKIHFQ